MDVRDSIIDLYNEIIATNKDLLKLTNINKKVVRTLNKSVNTLTMATAVCIIFTHMSIKKQSKTIKDLKHQIEELRNMKGE